MRESGSVFRPALGSHSPPGVSPGAACQRTLTVTVAELAFDVASPAYVARKVPVFCTGVPNEYDPVLFVVTVLMGVQVVVPLRCQSTVTVLLVAFTPPTRTCPLRLTVRPARTIVLSAVIVVVDELFTTGPGFEETGEATTTAGEPWLMGLAVP